VSLRSWVRHGVPALAAALLLAGCSDDTASSSDGSATSSSPAVPTAVQDSAAPASSPAGTTSTQDSASPSLPPAAGASEAAVARTLPEGPAGGSVVLTFDGLGEARSDFAGQCTRTGAGTTIAGTAGTAELSLEFTPDAVRLTVHDEGLDSEATVAAGDLTVDGGRLTLDAPMLEGGQTTGRVRVDIVCGG
jgi:hypothetical protein